MSKNALIRAKTRKQLAVEYGISTRTLYRWFQEHALYFPHNMLMPKEVELVYETFGYPMAYLVESQSSTGDDPFPA